MSEQDRSDLQLAPAVAEPSIADLTELYQLAVRGLEDIEEDLRDAERRLKRAQRYTDCFVAADVQDLTTISEHYRRDLERGRAVCDRLAAYLAAGDGR